MPCSPSWLKDVWATQRRALVLLLCFSVWLFVTPRAAAHQASLSLTITQSSPKFMSIESMKLSNHLVLLPSVFPSTGVFPSESAVCVRWTKYWRRTLNQTKYLFRARQSKMVGQRKHGRIAPSGSDLNYSKEVQLFLWARMCVYLPILLSF